MTLELTEHQRMVAAGTDGASTAMRLVAESARLLGASRLIPIASGHIDGALYHGDGGTFFAEHLADKGGRVTVRATLNVGALDLTGSCRVALGAHERMMAKRLMDAYRRLGCEPSWTCAPYQAGHRPAFGSDVAWGESNAVVFCNSVLGARTNRYGDFLDIACAITGHAPDSGLHRPENRKATIVFDLSGLDPAFLGSDIAWPILGTFFGRSVGSEIGVVTGVETHPGEDALKAFGAASASSGSVGLFHIVGVTPEAPDLDAVLASPAAHTIRVTMAQIRATQHSLSTATGATHIDAVAIGSPHLSLAECRQLLAHFGDRRSAVPFYACTGRHVLSELERLGLKEPFKAAGITIVVDTCVVVTPIMEAVANGVLMTNSGKFAYYAPGNTGYAVLYGSLADCVESAIKGRPTYGPVHGSAA